MNSESRKRNADLSPQPEQAEALAEVLGDIRVAGARQAKWWTNDDDHRLLIQVLRAECVPWAEGLLASDWFAAALSAAEERGRAKVVERVEVVLDGLLAREGVWACDLHPREDFPSGVMGCIDCILWETEQGTNGDLELVRAALSPAPQDEPAEGER